MISLRVGLDYFLEVQRPDLLGGLERDYHLLPSHLPGGGVGLKCSNHFVIPLEMSPGFLESADIIAPTCNKLLEILRDPAKCRKLKMELSITTDSMEP